MAINIEICYLRNPIKSDGASETSVHLKSESILIDPEIAQGWIPRIGKATFLQNRYRQTPMSAAIRNRKLKHWIRVEMPTFALLTR